MSANLLQAYRAAAVLTAALLASCGADRQQPRALNSRFDAVVYRACVEANSRANEAWQTPIGEAPGSLTAEEFRARLRAMIDACRPVVRPLRTKAAGPSCAEGYRQKIQVYEAVLIGATAGGGDRKLDKAEALLVQCDGGQRAAPLRPEEEGRLTKWVGLCVRGHANERIVKEAILASSSGDATLDEEMVLEAMGLPLPTHYQPGQWVSLGLARAIDGLEAAPMDDDALPDLGCGRFNKPAASR